MPNGEEMLGTIGTRNFCFLFYRLFLAAKKPFLLLPVRAGFANRFTKVLAHRELFVYFVRVYLYACVYMCVSVSSRIHLFDLSFPNHSFSLKHRTKGSLFALPLFDT